jgi:hypothetical protein
MCLIGWIINFAIRNFATKITFAKFSYYFGQLCKLDPDNVSNQIGQQQKITMKTLSAKFRETNFNFVFREIKKIDFRIHPSASYVLIIKENNETETKFYYSAKLLRSLLRSVHFIL